MTEVVNIRHGQPIDVYIGRAGHGHDGYFGNPVAIGKTCPECKQIHKDGGSTLPCYRKYLWRRMNESEEFCIQLLALQGSVLGCFCKPAPCHGDEMVKAIEWLATPGRSLLQWEQNPPSALQILNAILQGKDK